MILPSSCLSTVISFRPFSPHALLTRLARLLFHLLAQAEWPHVSPHFFDVSEALGFRARLARIVPTERVHDRPARSSTALRGSSRLCRWLCLLFRRCSFSSPHYLYFHAYTPSALLSHACNCSARTPICGPPNRV